MEKSFSSKIGVLLAAAGSAVDKVSGFTCGLIPIPAYALASRPMSAMWAG